MNHNLLNSIINPNFYLSKMRFQGAISLFLAVVNSIQVPVEELDDLLDLAAWYASCRLSPLGTEL